MPVLPIFDSTRRGWYTFHAVKVVIVGAGSVGVQLARQLISENRDVVLIEKDSDRSARAAQLLDCLIVSGSGTSPDVLRRAGCETADVFVAATDSDEVNMIACGIVASEFGAGRRIARVRSVEYHTSRLSERRFLGIDHVVNPETEAARAILRAVDFGAVSDVMVFERSDVQIRTVVVRNDGPLAGHALRDLSGILPGNFLVAVIARDGAQVVPSGDTTLVAGDILYIAAAEHEFDPIYERLGSARRDIRRIVIVGGGRIGAAVAESLIGERRSGVFARLTRRIAGKGGREIKIVERDAGRCKLLTERFANALIINADVSDDSVYEEGHFVHADLVISTTDNQELNIVTALYAKSLGVRRAIALVSRAAYAEVASKLGVDVAVSQKNAVVASILRQIRAGSVRSVHAISDGKLEAIELNVSADSRAVGMAVREIGLPKDALIVALERNGESIVPDGSSVLRSDDHLIVIARKEHADRVQSAFTVS